MYVIVNVGTGKAYKKPRAYRRTEYKTAAAAKGICTRFEREQVLSQWRVMLAADYDASLKMVERTNIMTGQKFMEAEDTPYFCSPSSERYWSM
jgi:hypothetical protein